MAKESLHGRRILDSSTPPSTQVPTPSVSCVLGSSVNDLEKYQVGTSFPHLAPDVGVFVRSCFLARDVVCVGQAERGER